MEVTAYFKNVRLPHWWWWIGVCAIGFLAFNPDVMIKPFLLVILGFSFLFASAYSLNNTLDHKSDKRYPTKTNPVALERISFEGGLAESIILGGVGLILLGLVSFEALTGGGLLLILSIVYHVPPFRTKARPYLDIITITLLYSTPFFIGYSAINPIDIRGASLAILFGLLPAITHPFHTAKDVEQDKRNGDNTVSVLIGIKKSIILSLALLVLTMAYFELLISAKLLDPKMFFIPITFIPSVFYYFHTIAYPSNKKIDTTVRILRLNGIIGGVLPTYLIMA
jgi:4-hydroxybenzoate polyprenyltransferase